MVGLPDPSANWLYRMISTKASLPEKVALFWHNVFATGYMKISKARCSSTRSGCSGTTVWAA